MAIKHGVNRALCWNLNVTSQAFNQKLTNLAAPQ